MGVILLVGLGNPGTQYEHTRHNAGFMLADRLRDTYGFPNWKSQSEGLASKGRIGPHEVVLLKPQTFMNLSGPCVQAVARFYKIPPAQVLVLHDELDVALGKVKHKLGGGDAGHNGLKSITRALGGAPYPRLRIGIGRPPHAGMVESYVLQPFLPDEQKLLDDVLGKLVQHMPLLLEKPNDALAKLGNVVA